MSEWLAMGGYGGYVWGSFGVALAVLIWDATAPMRMRRQLRRRRTLRRPTPRKESTT